MQEPILLTRPEPDDRPREIEPGLEWLAYWMDSAFQIPGVGVRFGLDALIGLVPGLGDTLTSIVSLYILGAARRYGVSRVTMLRMALNIALDYVVGAVPLVGDLFDVYWKANQMNVALLRRHVLATPAEQRRAHSGDRLFVAALIVVLALLLVSSVMLVYLFVGWLWRLASPAA